MTRLPLNFCCDPTQTFFFKTINNTTNADSRLSICLRLDFKFGEFLQIFQSTHFSNSCENEETLYIKTANMFSVVDLTVS